MTTSEPAPNDADATEHRTLLEALGRLEETNDLYRLLPRLELLGGILEHHFKKEEAKGGVRSEVRINAPYLLAALEKTFEEHGQFLSEVDALHGKIQACIDGPVAEILREVSALTRRIRDHEAREEELLSDVYYTDYGEGAD